LNDSIERPKATCAGGRLSWLPHRFAWSIDALITYRTTTRELDLFEAMEDATRRAVLEGLERRLRALRADQLVDRPPVVSIVARKP
jgi:hypothetical protein